jgi:Protein of unknown function (DUF2380)
MQINNHIFTCFLLLLLLNSAGTADAATSNVPRLMLMDFKLMGAIGEAKLDQVHLQRLAMANGDLRTQLAATKQFDLLEEKDTTQFNQKVRTALNSNTCDSCEIALAKQLKIEQILYPWVYKLSNLVLALHVVIIDVATGKAVVKKVLDFRGDNDQSWQRAIQSFVKQVGKP